MVVEEKILVVCGVIKIIILIKFLNKNPAFLYYSIIMKPFDVTIKTLLKIDLATIAKTSN